MGNLLALQDEITSRIANELNIELIAAEAARPTEHPDGLDYILRGRAAGFKPGSRARLAEAISLFEHASAVDPQSIEAQTRLAAQGRLVRLNLAHWDRCLLSPTAAMWRRSISRVRSGPNGRATR
jgi:hypothetical protein